MYQESVYAVYVAYMAYTFSLFSSVFLISLRMSLCGVRGEKTFARNLSSFTWTPHGPFGRWGFEAVLSLGIPL